MCVSVCVYTHTLPITHFLAIQIYFALVDEIMSNLKHPQTFVNSGLFSTSLITYDDGNNRTTDIDFVGENFGFLIMGECKKFRNNQIHIPLKQFTVLDTLYDCTKRIQVYIVGTEDYSKVYAHDVIYYTNFNLIRNKKTPFEHSPDACFSKYDMLPITRERFDIMLNKKLDIFGNPFHDPKMDMDYPSVKVGKIEM